MFRLILLFIIYYIEGKTIYNNDILIYECKTNENCFDYLSNSICFNNQCIDKLRFRRQIHFGNQNLGIRMLGEECLSNDECRRTPVDGTKICLINQCQCSSGHVPIDAYRCIRDFEQISSNNQITKSIDIEELPGYGSLCSTNNDCQRSTNQLECLHGTCVCLEGYVPLGKYLCYNIRVQDAPIIETSTLITTLSTILDLSNNQMIRYIGKLGNTCTNDYYCRQSVSKSYCYNGKCSCIIGYISIDFETCIENTNQESTNYKNLLGGKCLTNDNCQTLNARCLNNICTCPIGQFPIDSWSCLDDSDSSNVQTTTKTSSSSTTVFHWWPWTPSTTTSQSNILHFHCILDQECINMDINSHCTLNGRCVCNLGYRFDMTTKQAKCIRYKINEENCD